MFLIGGKHRQTEQNDRVQPTAWDYVSSNDMSQNPVGTLVASLLILASACGGGELAEPYSVDAGGYDPGAGGGMVISGNMGGGRFRSRCMGKEDTRSVSCSTV